MCRQAGNEVRIPAGEVVRLAAIYQKRLVSRVGAQLVEYAIGMDPSFERAIGAEVDSALVDSRRPVSDVDVEAFLIASRRLLPPVLAEQVEQAISHGHTGADTGVVGWEPGED